MVILESVIDERLITDTEKATFTALPLLVGADDAHRDRYAIQLADILGDPGEFQHYLSGSGPDRLARIDRLLVVFQENTELLVHKTWVEKSEEKPKFRFVCAKQCSEKQFN